MVLFSSITPRTAAKMVVGRGWNTGAVPGSALGVLGRSQRAKSSRMGANPVVASNEDLSAPLKLRAARSTAVVFFVIWLVPSAFITVAIVGQPTVSGGRGIMALIALYAAVLFLWVSRFRIELSERSFSYTSLFTGTSSIAIKDIQSVRKAAGNSSDGGRLIPPIRIEIAPKPNTGAKKIIVNAKVFDRDAMDRLIARLIGSGDRNTL
jgi:hypothetical protein